MFYNNIVYNNIFYNIYKRINNSTSRVMWKAIIETSYYTLL